jgi:type I restriction enzyme M protein
MSVRSVVKSIQDTMRQDAGVDGDAQRVAQLCWMFFLKSSTIRMLSLN